MFLIKCGKNKYFSISLCAVIIFSLNLPTVQATILFQDSFESGGLSHEESGIRWLASNAGSGDLVTVTNEHALTGDYALKFLFGGNPSASDDAWAEQRMSLGGQKTELWIQYYLYLPSNYSHRDPGVDNNKFIAIYRAPYTNPGFQVNFSTRSLNSRDSRFDIHYYHSGVEEPKISFTEPVWTDTERGRWNKVIIHVKVPSGDTDDGVLELYVNDVKKIGLSGLNSYGGVGQNYFDELYLLGWANSGFDVDTTIYIDDVTISSTILVDPSPTKPAIVKDFMMDQ